MCAGREVPRMQGGKCQACQAENHMRAGGSAMRAGCEVSCVLAVKSHACQGGSAMRAGCEVPCVPGGKCHACCP
eukprot:351277-Chlamydomonas_euryale.AAC.5